MLLAGALLVGLTFGPVIERLFLRRIYGQAEAIHLLPELELVATYLMMVLVLLIRPQGLFGEVELRRI